MRHRHSMQHRKGLHNYSTCTAREVNAELVMLAAVRAKHNYNVAYSNWVELDEPLP